MDHIRSEQDAALERAKDAVASALAATPDERNKRAAAGAAGDGRPAKKQRPSRVLGNVLPSDSEDEEGVQALSKHSCCLSWCLRLSLCRTQEGCIICVSSR